jgi:hypothetical protein
VGTSIAQWVMNECTFPSKRRASEAGGMNFFRLTYEGVDRRPDHCLDPQVL